MAKSRGWLVVKYASHKAGWRRGVKTSNEADEFTLARKAAKVDIEVPVPQTDTGRRQENCKTNGITIG